LKQQADEAQRRLHLSLFGFSPVSSLAGPLAGRDRIMLANRDSAAFHVANEVTSAEDSANEKRARSGFSSTGLEGAIHDMSYADAREIHAVMGNKLPPPKSRS